ncbi:MAG: hypothetical protein GY811_14305, partial [Myxococcales bacterium]|nr:hypothetical protein [Myxococcales bacterium]
YSSNLNAWRAQQERLGVGGLEAQKPGPKPGKDAKDRLLAKQQRKIASLERENRIQKGLIELQRKAQEIFAEALPEIEDKSNDDSSSWSSSAPRKSR